MNCETVWVREPPKPVSVDWLSPSWLALRAYMIQVVGDSLQAWTLVELILERQASTQVWKLQAQHRQHLFSHFHPRGMTE